MATLPERLDFLALATLNRSVNAAVWTRVGTAYAYRDRINFAALSQADQARLILERAHELLLAPVRQYEAEQAGMAAQSTTAAAFNADMTPTP